jgi:hypothetical protein
LRIIQLRICSAERCTENANPEREQKFDEPCHGADLLDPC